MVYKLTLWSSLAVCGTNRLRPPSQPDPAPNPFPRPTLGVQGGRTCIRASRVFCATLSGNFTANSSTMSPLLSGHLDRGSPSPTTLFFMPGLMTSRDVTVMVRPSSVGALIEHPHRACAHRKNKIIRSTKQIKLSVTASAAFPSPGNGADSATVFFSPA